MKQIVILIVGLVLSQVAFAQKINSQKSKIEFEVNNMGKVVNGTILNLKGLVNFDKNNLGASGFNATVAPSTIRTGSRGRDKHLQKNDFFGVAVFPEIKMVGKSLKKTETGYEALATLTIRDISKEVMIPFSVIEGKEQLTLTGNFSLKRKDYQLGEKVGKDSIGLEVTVQIYCVVDL